MLKFHPPWRSFVLFRICFLLLGAISPSLPVNDLPLLGNRAMLPGGSHLSPRLPHPIPTLRVFGALLVLAASRDASPSEGELGADVSGDYQALCNPGEDVSDGQDEDLFAGRADWADGGLAGAVHSLGSVDSENRPWVRGATSVPATTQCSDTNPGARAGDCFLSY